VLLDLQPHSCLTRLVESVFLVVLESLCVCKLSRAHGERRNRIRNNEALKFSWVLKTCSSGVCLEERTEIRIEYEVADTTY